LITDFIIFIGTMYVCVCLAVTDQEVDAAIDEGASTCEAVTRACGAGGDCGSCHEMIEQRIDAKRLVRERAA
jgi:bacterioferritin-associated ferredoxin